MLFNNLNSEKRVLGFYLCIKQHGEIRRGTQRRTLLHNSPCSATSIRRQQESLYLVSCVQLCLRVFTLLIITFKMHVWKTLSCYFLELYIVVAQLANTVITLL